MNSIPEPEAHRPWRPSDGPEPEVWMWPSRDPPVLWVWSNGQHRRATVMAKQVWADGSVIYQVSVDLRGDMSVTERKYRWPQPGLSVARRSRFEPTRGVRNRRPREEGGEVPRPPTTARPASADGGPGGAGSDG